MGTAVGDRHCLLRWGPAETRKADAPKRAPRAPGGCWLAPLVHLSLSAADTEAHPSASPSGAGRAADGLHPLAPAAVASASGCSLALPGEVPDDDSLLTWASFRGQPLWVAWVWSLLCTTETPPTQFCVLSFLSQNPTRRLTSSLDQSPYGFEIKSKLKSVASVLKPFSQRPLPRFSPTKSYAFCRREISSRSLP